MIKPYFKAFINWEKNDEAKLLLIADFHHNNAKTRNIYHTLFKCHYKSYPGVLFKDEANSHLKSYSTHK